MGKYYKSGKVLYNKNIGLFYEHGSRISCYNVSKELKWFKYSLFNNCKQMNKWKNNEINYRDISWPVGETINYLNKRYS